MSERRRIEWLSSELDALEREGVRPRASCPRGRERRERQLASLRREAALPAFLGALSALLIGLGGTATRYAFLPMKALIFSAR
ncbi:MAG: hypothetical protein NT080_10960 [Spirochaetes bacterium]|nr:hypothetical protein [Spirochaetota bacterium]